MIMVIFLLCGGIVKRRVFWNVEKNLMPGLKSPSRNQMWFDLDGRNKLAVLCRHLCGCIGPRNTCGAAVKYRPSLVPRGVFYRIYARETGSRQGKNWAVWVRSPWNQNCRDVATDEPWAWVHVLHCTFGSSCGDFFTRDCRAGKCQRRDGHMVRWRLLLG